MLDQTRMSGRSSLLPSASNFEYKVGKKKMNEESIHSIEDSFDEIRNFFVYLYLNLKQLNNIII